MPPFTFEQKILQGVSLLMTDEDFMADIHELQKKYHLPAPPEQREKSTLCHSEARLRKAQLWRTEGGRGGIRTHGTVAGTTVFETVLFDHSSTLPYSSNRLSVFNYQHFARVLPTSHSHHPLHQERRGRVKIAQDPRENSL